MGGRRQGPEREVTRRVAKGIQWTPSGWRLFVRVGQRLTPKRIYDPSHEKGLVELRQIKEDHRAAERKARHVPAPAAAGTFADDARRKYLPAVKARVGAERIYHIELWIAEFGTRPRASIQPWEIAAVRDRWLTEGPKRVCVPWDDGHPKPKGCRTGRWITVKEPLSASQVNNRLRALENLWTVLDGRHAYNPVREAGEAREPDQPPKAVSYEVVDAILAAMPDRGAGRKGHPRSKVSLTKLRLRVIAYTGFSHGELASIRAEDLALDETPPRVYVAGRKKGRGTTGVMQPLVAEGAAALRALAEADGLGPFSADSMNDAFQRACAKLDLHGITPYAFRHAFATETLKQTGGNIGATQLMMRQRDQRTTLRYAKGAIDPVRLATAQHLRFRR